MNANVDRLSDVLADLIRAARVSDDGRSLEFRQAAGRGLAALRADPPAPDSVRIDGAWTLALGAADSPNVRDAGGHVDPTFPRSCVFTLSELLEEGFDVDRAVDRIRKSASTG